MPSVRKSKARRPSTTPETPTNSTRPSTTPETPTNSTRPSTSLVLPKNSARPSTTPEPQNNSSRPSTSTDPQNISTRPSTSSEASKSYLRSIITPTRKPEKKRWNFNPKLDAKERPVRTPKKPSERFLSLSRPAVSKPDVIASTSTKSTSSATVNTTGETVNITGETAQTSGETVRTTGETAKTIGQIVKTKSQTGKTAAGTARKARPKTVVRKESDKLIVTYTLEGIPVVIVESGPNKGKVLPIPPIPSARLRLVGSSSRPSTSSNSKAGVKATGQKSAQDGNPSVAGGSKEETPNPKQPKKIEAPRNEETKKWEAFFKNQSVDALLACCEFAGPGDLVRIHHALREKLGMNGEKPWVQISLPRNFVALLNEMTTRTHTEPNDDSRIAMFRILLDLAERYEPDGLPTFHNDIGLVLCLDQRLHLYRQYDGVLPKPIQDEYRVIMQLKTWLYNTYDTMMESGSWVPRTPRPESSMLRTTFDTQYALDNLFSLEKIFTSSDSEED